MRTLCVKYPFSVKFKPNQGILKIWPQVDLWPWMNLKVNWIYLECYHNHSCQIWAKSEFFDKTTPIWPLTSEALDTWIQSIQNVLGITHLKFEPTWSILQIWPQVVARDRMSVDHNIGTHIKSPCEPHRCINPICHCIEKIWTKQKACTKCWLTHWLTHSACSQKVFPNGGP